MHPTRLTVCFFPPGHDWGNVLPSSQSGKWMVMSCQAKDLDFIRTQYIPPGFLRGIIGIPWTILAPSYTAARCRKSRSGPMRNGWKFWCPSTPSCGMFSEILAWLVAIEDRSQELSLDAAKNLKMAGSRNCQLSEDLFPPAFFKKSPSRPWAEVGRRRPIFRVTIKVLGSWLILATQNDTKNCDDLMYYMFV